MSVTLTPLTRAQLDPVRALKPAPEQMAFTGQGKMIADDPRPNVMFHGILHDGQLVGVLKVDPDYEDGRHFGPKGCWGLRSVLIDRASQGQGIGTRAFRALPDHLRRHYPDLPEIYLTVNHRNAAARALYLKTGWQDTGEDYHGGEAGPQHILRLDLS